MEFIKGWRVVRLVKSATGRDKLEVLSRTFAVRDAALIYAEWCGDGAHIKAVRACTDDAKPRLC